MTGREHLSGAVVKLGEAEWRCGCGERFSDYTGWLAHSEPYRERPDTTPAPGEGDAVTRLLDLLHEVYKPEGVVIWLNNAADKIDRLASGTFG